MMRFLLISLFFYGCKSITPEPPFVVKAVAPPPKIIVSTITLPVEISLHEGLKQVETSVPLKFQGADQPCSGLGYSYIFERNPISFEFQDNNVFFSVSGGLGLDVNYCPSCHSLFGDERCVIPRVYGSCGTNGESRRKLLTQFQTVVNLNNNYKIESKTTLNYVKLIDPCQFSFMKINVTKEIEKTLETELIKQEKEIDQQISSVSVRPQIVAVWEKLQDPIALFDFGYLYLQPKGITFEKITFKQKQAFSNLQLTLSPIVQTTKQTAIKKSALPLATQQKSTNRFGLYVDVVATYDSLNNYINKALKGKPIEIERKKIYVDSAALFQVSLDTLGIKISFSGYKNGTMYFKGLPHIDSLTQQLNVKNLSYSLSTKSVLLNAAKWLYTDKILEYIQNKSGFSFDPYLEDIKETITKNLNQELYSGVFLSGKLLDFSPKQLFIQEKNIVVRCLMQADLKLKIY